MTKLLYLEQNNLLQNSAKIVSVSEEDGRQCVVLDQTIFYPQGGGQPADTGSITSNTTTFIVTDTRFVDGVVKHYGTFETGSFSTGEMAHCVVDSEKRTLHSRIHSAGHVIDMGIKTTGLNWIPGKGYHFPQGPYVEYVGSLDGQDVEKLKKDLENACNSIIRNGQPVSIQFMPKEQMLSVCDFVPDYLPAGKPARVVLFGSYGIPCGGTHVSDLKEIKGIVIRKIKKEKENVRVAYEVI